MIEFLVGIYLITLIPKIIDKIAGNKNDKE